MFEKKAVNDVFNQLYVETFSQLDDEADKLYGFRYTQLHESRFVSTVCMLPPIGRDARVLEIGPSIISPLMKKLAGSQVAAIDISDINRNFLDMYDIPLHVCDLTQQKPPLEKESFDLVFFCETIEHFVTAPLRALKTIVELIKPGGTIFFSAPNFASIEKRIKLLCGENPQECLHESVPHFAHIREPVIKEAVQWWNAAGARVIQKGHTDFLSDKPLSLINKIKASAWLAMRANWYGIAHVLVPSFRNHFYLILSR